MKVTTLLENTKLPDAEECLVEPGLAVHIEGKGKTILADVGATDRFIHNAKQLGVDVGAVDMVVISHAHYDHGGGLKHFFEVNDRATVYMHREAMGEYFSRRRLRRISIGLDRDLLKTHADRVHLVEAFTEIADGIFILTDIPQSYPMPRGNRNLLKKEGRKFVPDTFEHEILLVIQEKDGLVLYSGCAHRGILNILEATTTQFPDRPIKAVLGGFHLIGPRTKKMAGSREEVEGIGREMLKYPIERVYTGHCTGLEAYDVLATVMGDRLGYLATGSEFTV